MAARKTAKKKTTKKKTAKKTSAAARLQAELPKSLRDYTKQVRKQLNAIEKDVEKARAQASRRGTKLLREASEYVGKLEARGEKQWKKTTDPYRRDAVKWLKKLERAVAPKPARKKKAAKRKTARA